VAAAVEAAAVAVVAVAAVVAEVVAAVVAEVAAVEAAGNQPWNHSPTFEGRKKQWCHTLIEKKEIHGLHIAGCWS
jgi:hypothetical protein